MTYQEKKERARNEALEWWGDVFPTASLSYWEIADVKAHFEKLGKRYGLLREFRDNWII